MKYTALTYEKYMKIEKGQDGAIYNGLLFRFDSRGHCYVYDLEKKAFVSEFVLDRADEYSPHSNTVFFGTEKIKSYDEFPLLYTNIYNNYKKAADRREGMLCAYRITRQGDSFSTKLVQIIKIGFVEDLTLWKSMEDGSDKRPYGNFILDSETNRLYAFIMRDKEPATRYFAFDMPSPTDGEILDDQGLKCVFLTKENILAQFDGSWAHYLQGACLFDGMLVSIEGGTVRDPENVKHPPRMQIMDVREGRQIADINMYALGFDVEPELICPYNGVIYYADCEGQVYTLTLEQYKRKSLPPWRNTWQRSKSDIEPKKLLKRIGFWTLYYLITAALVAFAALKNPDNVVFVKKSWIPAVYAVCNTLLALFYTSKLHTKLSMINNKQRAYIYHNVVDLKQSFEFEHKCIKEAFRGLQTITLAFTPVFFVYIPFFSSDAKPFSFFLGLVPACIWVWICMWETFHDTEKHNEEVKKEREKQEQLEELGKWK